MSTLNKYEDGQWQALSSTDASLITSNSSVLREYLGLEGSEIPNTEEVMEALIKDSKTLKSNVSWLALHGGGGGSGSGGGGGGNAQADGIIYVNNSIESGSAIVRKDTETMSFVVKAGPSGISYEWNYTILFEDKVIKSGKITTNNTIVIFTANLIPEYLNGQGRLSITCTSGLKSIYWNGTIILNLLNIEAATSTSSIDISNLDSSFININYSSSVLGDYIISINDTNNYKVTVSDITMKYTYTIKVSDIYGVDNVGSNTTKISIRNVETGDEQSTTIEVVIVSNNIVISSSTLSKDKESPTSVIYGSTIPIQFTAYLSGGSFFNYSITIDNQLVASYENARFGSIILLFIPSTSYEYEENRIYTIVIAVNSSNLNPVTATYYVKFEESSTLLVKTPLTSYLLSDFIAYGDTSFDESGKWKSLCNDYIYLSGSSSVELSIQLNNPNILSGIKLPGLNPPYFRLSNKAYGVLSDYLIDGTTVTLKDLINSKRNISISICFKADYHTDDKRTVLVLGDYSIDKNNEYDLNQGIEITVHEVKIKSRNSTLSIPLLDSEIINLDITYNNETKITKVYIDGVITGSANDIDLYTIIGTNLVDSHIYLGCSKYDLEYFNYADVLYYRLMIYSTALNDYEILLNFLQNLSYTNFTILGLPDGNFISEGFNRNFINYNSTSGTVEQSYLWDDSSKSYSVRNFITTSLDESGTYTGINPNISLYTIPLPILYIDLSSFEAWTWSNFTSNNASTVLNLKDNPAYGAVFNYYDPKGTSTDIIKGGCAISILGTSTLNDIIKNLNFGLNWENVDTKTVFIPKSNWCPEDLYTLKADIVDSSHSSNASIGKFINDVLANTEEGAPWYLPHEGALNKFKSGSFYSNSSSSNYKPTMKVAVEGFPVFVIIRFYSSDISVVDVHSLGIYQFILGRDSAHNLGMKSLKSILDNTGEIIHVDRVPYYKEGCIIEEFDMSSQWVEASTTISMQVGVDLCNDDFNTRPLTAVLWLYDKDTVDKLYEVKYGTSTNASDVPGFTDLVRNIALAPIRRYNYFSTEANEIVGVDYSDGYDGYKTLDGINWNPTGLRVVLVKTLDDLDNLLDSLDLLSAYKYATVALLFGLIDNFCKNMPFISFDNDTKFKIGFYDMDSAFGMTNLGELGVLSYVYLKGLRNNQNNLVEEYYLNVSDAQAVSGKDNKLFLSLESSAVMAKDLGLSSSSGNRYSDYWVDLRNTLRNRYNGKYETLADFFVEEYFKPLTEGCGELLFNLTYQAKYIDTKTYTKLHGRRISLVRLWLKEHIKFLDSITLWKTSNSTLLLGSESIKTISLTSFDYYTTINTKTNTPLLITTTNLGGSYKYITFCPKNENTDIIYGGGTTTSSVSKTISYSDNLLTLGNDTNSLGKSGFLKINNGTLLGFNDLNLLGCETFSSDNNSPIDFISTFYDNGSELRSINLSNTSGAKNLSLLLLDFTKLTDINILNGCVSSIILPETPLVSLNVTNSALTNYTLNSLALLEEADVEGCSLLLEITISNCENLLHINNIRNLTNLNRVSIAGCPKVSNLTISDCPNLTSIEIHLNLLKTLVINNCPKLTSLTISECSLTLNSLNLEGCTSLNIINCDNLSYTFLSTINFRNTSISQIKWGTSILDLECLDLYNMPNLKTVIILTNNSVKLILFSNSELVKIPLTNPFTGCTNLERIYGNVSVLCNSCFYRLNKFSIHGSNTNTSKWKGKSVLQGTRIMMPYEILLLDDPSEVSFSNLYLDGRKVTNMSFTTCNSVFRETNYTIFDIYYALSNIGDATDCSSMFYSGKNTSYGVFNESTDNSPNKYMFSKCLKVTTISGMFWECGSGSTIKLYSPTVLEGKVIEDDGLFSPLTSITNINNAFGSYTTVVDRFVFRRSDNTLYKIVNMSRFYMNWIVDDSKSTDVPNSPVDAFLNLDSYGDLSDFFVNLQNLSDTSSGSISGIAGLGHNTNFIDYEKTSNFLIPSKVKSCRSVLDAKYAKGEIILDNLFSTPSNVLYIYNSFRVINSNSALSCVFNITDDTLANFSSLRALGYIYDSVNGLSGSNTTGSLTGPGLTKIIKLTTFPFNIFNSCASTLINVDGLFSSTSILEDNIYGSEVLYLPGTLFSNTINIQRISATFYDFKVPFLLNSGGFSNCTKLLTVELLFANCGSNISGYIPNKLFYHGQNKTTITRTGTNIEPIKDEETGIWDVLGKETISFSYDLPNTKITTLEGCFTGSYELIAYEHETTENEIERNPEYYPFRYIQNSTGDWILNEAYNEYEYTYRWTYDGVHRPTTSLKVDNLDDGYAIDSDKIVDGTDNYKVSSTIIDTRVGTPSDTMNFFCAPDLLRYCSNVSSLEINSLFKDCGSLRYDSNIDSKIIYGRGIKGRIPPYLLKPVSNVTNISYIFYGCRALSCYTIEELNSYLIPRDFFKYAPKINNLEGAFAGMRFPKSIDLNVFNTLSTSNTLNLGKIFVSSYFEDGATVSGIFNSYNVNKTEYAFAVIETTNKSSVIHKTNLKITFSNVFKNYNTSGNATNTNYRYTFAWYNKDSVKHETTKTLCNNTTTYNYVYSDGSIPS